MTHYDDVVRGALSPEDLSLYEALGRARTPVQQAFDTMRGEQRAFIFLVWAAGVAFLCLAVFAGVHFAGATSPRAMAGWAALAAFAVFSLGMLKLWFWMEVQKLTIMRELKRIELQLSATFTTSRSERAS
jgi:hypothetical protein